MSFRLLSLHEARCELRRWVVTNSCSIEYGATEMSPEAENTVLVIDRVTRTTA